LETEWDFMIRSLTLPVLTPTTLRVNANLCSLCAPPPGTLRTYQI